MPKIKAMENNTNCLAGLACPRCATKEPLLIEVQTMASIFDDGIESFGDTEWDDDSYITCPGCGYTNTVDVFRNPLACAETYYCLALSTRHLTEEAAAWLARVERYNPMVTAKDTGFTIKVYPGDKETPVALWTQGVKSLHDLLVLAQEHGFRMVEFDNDAPVVATLPTYDR